MGHRLSAASVAAAGVAAAFVLPASAAATTTPPSDPAAEARVADALAAFDAAAVEAGFAADGTPGDLVDPIGLAATEEPGPADQCIAGFEATVAEDGTFTGQVAGLTSADYYLTDGAPLPTDGTGFELDTLEASVAVVDPSAHDGLAGMIDAFASDTLAECLTEAFSAMADDAEIELTEMQVTAEPVDLGDGGALVRLSISAEQDGETRSTTTAFGVALLADAVAVVTLDSVSADPSFDILETSLDAIVTSLAG